MSIVSKKYAIVRAKLREQLRRKSDRDWARGKYKPGHAIRLR